jgi:predicted dehydrogenase
MEKDGTSNAVIEFEGGRLGYHFGTWGARGTKLGYSFQAHCTEGMLEIDFQGGKLLGHKNVRGEDVADATEVLLDVKGRKFTENELAHFLDCIETGATPMTDAPGSLQGLRVIWRLYEAEDNGAMADLRGLGLDDEYQG